MANALDERKEAYMKKMEAKRARISSANIGISPETKRLKKLETQVLKELGKVKLTIGKERE